MTRLAWLAFEGFDWDLAQALVDDGRMPCLAQLLAAGRSGPMSLPPPVSPAINATTLATGVLADRHGVCHAFAPRRDGLTISPIGLEAVRLPSLWLRAAAAGQSVRVAGWPASLPNDGARLRAPLPQRAHIAGLGFEMSGNATVEHWPMPPHMVWPPPARSTVEDALIHPEEIDDDTIRPLCGSWADGHLRRAAREFLAQTATIQALGMAWLEQADATLIALRFAALPAWTAQLRRRAGTRLPDAIAPTCQWLDLLIGRWMNAVGRQAHLVITTEGGLPGAGYRRAQGRGRGPGGGLAMAGPGIPADSLMGPATALDVCPTLMHLLGLPDADATALDGRNLLGAASPQRPRAADRRDAPQPPADAAVPQDGEALQHLLQIGVPLVDVGVLQTQVARVRHESRRTWAWVRRLRGHLDEACDELARLATEESADSTTLLMLAECLLATGRTEQAAALPCRRPAGLHGPDWDALDALADYARRDWPSLEERLERLAHQDLRWINPAAWLGWSLMARGQHQRALDALERAAERPEEPLRVWEGMTRALLHLGRPEEALRSIGRAIAEQPYSGVLHRLRGDALEAAGRHEPAVDAWYHAWTLAPRLSGLAEQLGRALNRRRAGARDLISSP
jgi:tetratricopeptide (TPR) repeat protein